MKVTFEHTKQRAHQPSSLGFEGVLPSSFLLSSSPMRLTIPSHDSMLHHFMTGCWTMNHNQSKPQAALGKQPSPGDAVRCLRSHRMVRRQTVRGFRRVSNRLHTSLLALSAFDFQSIDHAAPMTPWAFVLPMGSWIPMTNYASMTDLDLVEAARQDNDRRAFAELLQRYQRPLYNYILRMVRQPAEAEELFQETFLRIYQNLENFRGGASFSPWAYRIAHNICIDALRSPRNRMNVPLDAEHGETNQSLADRLEGRSPNPEDELYRQQVGVRIQEAVEKLPPAIRAVFVLYQYQHLPYEQIAESLDIPLGTVKSRMHTALRKLSHYLRQLSPTGEDPRDSKDSNDSNP
ncbi:MAG: sigma-70 family RNA polymerase sigma factor [Myxococcales bacterium]|nr:sigma-70 family RNA polymerase sigma factor [Myxococcales bacterium]MCB9644182.1 sigma-70 family RNA polymerase sigma factor [Myxococcales bacterium]